MPSQHTYSPLFADQLAPACTVCIQVGAQPHNTTLPNLVQPAHFEWAFCDPSFCCLQHNFGAVLRSAQFLGASGVMASQKNCAPLSAAVSKASAGALEAVPVHACANLPRLLSEAAASGWTVLGAAAEEGAQACTQVGVQGPTTLVVGSEGVLMALACPVLSCRR